MACSVAPALQHSLVAAQAGGRGLQSALEAALDACSIGASGSTAALRRSLLAAPVSPAPLLAAAANASGHPCACGILLARLLDTSICGAGELLAAADPSDLALAVADLHAAAASGTLPAASAAAARAAFTTLLKMLATAGGEGSEQGRAAERAMAHLRHAWLAPAPDCHDAFAMAAGGSHAGGHTALLLAAAVDTVDAEVFPRKLAHRQARCTVGPGWGASSSAARCL